MADTAAENAPGVSSPEVGACGSTPVFYLSRVVEILRKPPRPDEAPCLTSVTDQVIDALRPVEDPELHRSIVDLGMVRDVGIDADGRVGVAGRPHRGRLPAAQRDHQPRSPPPSPPLDGVRGRRPRLHGDDRRRARGAAPAPPRRPGGHCRPARPGPRSRRGPGDPVRRARLEDPPAADRVGQGRRRQVSSVTTNLAVALAQQGHSVGVVDADVYGFSIPRMLGTDRDPVVHRRACSCRPRQWGVRCISIGYFVPDGQAVIWRGPMLHKALEQFLTDVYWDDPDFLLIDMPPGTGDIALSLSPVPARGPRCTSSPRRSRRPRRWPACRRPWPSKVNMEVKGVIENMSLVHRRRRQALRAVRRRRRPGAGRRAGRAAARPDPAAAAAARGRRRRHARSRRSPPTVRRRPRSVRSPDASPSTSRRSGSTTPP